jgi:hypothetical protein
MVSDAARYHPFRKRKASCTSPFAKSALIDLPMPILQATLSLQREAQMRHYVRLPSARYNFPTHRRAVRCPTKAHDLSEIQSPLAQLGLDALYNKTTEHPHELSFLPLGECMLWEALLFALV